MKYIVIWSPEAEQDLTALWLTSRWRHLVASAADQIDELLSRDPKSVGESRDANIRIVFVSPLAAEFEVVELESAVYVRGIWEY
jgi:hypothetical protein